MIGQLEMEVKLAWEVVLSAKNPTARENDVTLANQVDQKQGKQRNAKSAVRNFISKLQQQKTLDAKADSIAHGLVSIPLCKVDRVGVKC